VAANPAHGISIDSLRRSILDRTFHEVHDAE
jgi:hypothetical protein